MIQGIRFKNNTEFVLRDEFGNIKQQVVVQNTLTSVGIDFLCDSIGNSTRPALLSHIGVGTGVAGGVGATDLTTPLLRNASIYTHVAATTSFKLTATFAAGEATGVITELGAFNAASAGTMFNSLSVPAIDKQPTDTLEVNLTYDITN